MWLEDKRVRCSDCGTAPYEWEENEDAWYADHVRCPGCERVQAHAREVSNSPGSHDGFKFALFKTPREG